MVCDGGGGPESSQQGHMGVIAPDEVSKRTKDVKGALRDYDESEREGTVMISTKK